MHVDERSRSSALIIYAMAVAAGLAVANIYYNQPMLERIEADLPGPFVGLVPVATQLGYAAGLLLIAPLGDVVDRRRLICIQFALLAIALIAAAAAPTGLLLATASLFVGITASVAQLIVPFAAHLSAPENRGAAIGKVLAGILAGILLSRTIAGFVATYAGWREMFWLGVPAAIGAGVMMWRLLPAIRPEANKSYGKLITSLGQLWRDLPELRIAAITQALLFAAFSVFWTVLVFRLQSPAFGFGPDIAGLFGIIGMTGILAAPLAGGYADRRGPRPVVLAGALLTLAAWLILGLWGSIAGLVVGVIVLDFATQSALVSNQHIIFSLRPEARARLNTVLMGTMFIGGAAGSAAGMFIWTRGGWTGVSVLGTALGIFASLIQIRSMTASR